MGKSKAIQVNFNIGEISPEMYMRIDTDQYRAAAKSVLNGVPIPQGGITKRKGFNRLLELTPTPKGGGFVKLIPLEFGEQSKYICILNMDGSFDFYTITGSLLQSTIPRPRAPTSNYDETDTRFIRGTDIRDVQWSTTLDPTEVVVTHPLYAPITIKFLGSNSFAVYRTIFQQYVKKEEPKTVVANTLPSTYVWSPSFNGTSHVTFPNYLEGYVIGDLTPEVLVTPIECTLALTLYMDTNSSSGWYPFAISYDPQAKKDRTVYIRWDKDKKKFTGMRWTDENGLPEYHYKVEFGFESDNSDARIEIYSFYQMHVGGSRIFSEKQVITVAVDGKRVFTFDQTRFGRNLYMLQYHTVGKGFKGTITDVRLTGSNGDKQYALKVIGDTRPTITDLGNRATLVNPANPSWIKIGLADGGILPPDEGEGGIVPPDTNIPTPSYNGYVPIHAPKDTFGYTRYVSSPWDTMQMTFSAKNNDVFQLNYDGSSTTKELTYNVAHVSITDGTQAGDTVGDDASAMVNAMTQAIKEWGVTNFNVRAEYTITSKNIYSATGGISVNERKFDALIVHMPSQDFEHPKRIWCSDKTSYESMLLVRPIGGTVQSIPTSDQESYTGEPVWSDNRGYPAVSTVHGGRVVYGGSYAKPLGLWFTQSGLSYHFSPDNLEEPLANDSISALLNSPTVGAITGMVSGRTLLVLTSTAMMSVTGENGVITPLSFAAKVEAQHGSKYVKPVYMDNKSYYIHADTHVLNSTAYDYTKDTYLVNSESLLSSHLVRDVNEMVVIESLSEANATYLVLRNGDGKLSTYCSIESQGIAAWSRFDTDGTVLNIAGLSEHLLIAVRRGNKLFLESMTPDSPYCDSAVTLESTTPFKYVGDMLHLAGKNIAVLADGYPLSLTVNSNGVVELPFTASMVQYGIPIEFEIETLTPLVQSQGNPLTVNEKKRVSKVKVDFINSMGVDVEYCDHTYPIADRNMGFLLNTPPSPYTGTKSINLLGWSVEGTIKVKSNEPVPVTLTAIEKTVRFNG